MSAKQVFIILFMMLTVGATGAFANELNFAYVDIATVFDNYEKTKENDKTLQEEGRKKEEERDALVHEVRQIKDEIILLNADAKEKKQDELEGKVRELQDFDRNANKELGAKRREVVRGIFKDIDDTVKRYGERKGIDFILNEKSLLYHSTRHDVTNEILKELNADFAKNRR